MLLYKKGDAILMCHKKYLDSIYKDVQEQDKCSQNYCILSILFSFVSRNKINRSRKRNREDLHSSSEEAYQIKNKFTQFVDNIPELIKIDLLSKNVLDISSAREFPEKLFKDTNFDHKGISGGNNSGECLKCEIKNEFFLIPPHCRFICGDVAEGCKKLAGSTKFDILIADPPWWNKYIRRINSADNKLGYSMMYNEDIAAIPIQPLLAENCLIAIWCTNAPSNISAVKNILFPKWGVEYKTTWYWVKVATSLDPICEFSSGCRKQPYERIILGVVGSIGNIPEDFLVVSVPSALHSHKPSIVDLLKPYVKTDEPNVVELFARYLLPHTTSIGFEPLKWQHISLYHSNT